MKKHLKILLIEDSPADVVFFSRTLKKVARQVEIIHAQTLSEALRALESPDFDLVFSDMNLSDSNPNETLHTILKYIPPWKAILLSGHFNQKILDCVQNLGTIELMPKDRLLDADYFLDLLSKKLPGFSFQKSLGRPTAAPKNTI